MLRKRQLFVLAVFLCALRPSAVFADTPMAEIKETIGEVVKIVTGRANSDAQRKQLLREALMPRFDWVEMARQTLGKHWDVAAGREDEFVSTLAEFLGNVYVGRIASYKDEKFLFVQESVENDRAQVKTKIISQKGDSTSVNYDLHRIGGEWKIDDVIVEDISLVANYRSQFNRVLAKGSFDDLLRQLREKEAAK